MLRRMGVSVIIGVLVMNPVDADPLHGPPLAGEAPLFLSAQGRRLSKRRAQQVFAIWQERAGLDQRHTFHRLRHTAVNAVYRSTRDLLLTQRFARHSSLLVTSVYCHPDDEDLARSVANVRC